MRETIACLPTYWKSVYAWVNRVNQIINSLGIVVLCPSIYNDDGRCILVVEKIDGGEDTQLRICMSWHRMAASYDYEMVGYVT